MPTSNLLDEGPRARPGEFRPLSVGPIEVWPPVVLAPMAGVTNAPFRRLCRRYGAGLYVSEMVNARGLVEGGAKSWQLAAFDADESPRSIQLYGTDPATMGGAVRRLIDEGGVDHIDLNFGCPVRKVTRHGGGSALPLKPRLLAAVIGATVEAAGAVPVTVKVRLGIDDELVTYLDAGRVAAESGAAAIALHGRTAAQLYSGRADWTAIARLKAACPIPVLGNGDVWQATDAVEMLRQTGADGVVIGRGCLGRPWFFRDLVDAFEGRDPAPTPRLGDALGVMVEHANLLVERRGEAAGLRDLRKHTSWYLTGYPVGGAVRRRLAAVESLAGLEAEIASLDPSIAASPEAVRSPRGTQAGPQSVTLPHRWLDHRDDLTPWCRVADAAVEPGARPRLVLASGSPRRRELLDRLGLRYTVTVPAIDEAPRPGEDPAAYVDRLARAKAEAVAGRPEGPGASVVLAADTTVALAGTILGKPADAADAAVMLRALSDRTHQVFTGVAVVGAGGTRSSVTTTEVTFRPLTSEEIAAYVASGDPLDKAGAYGIQGDAGRFVARVRGSASNVVGLPVAQTMALLSAAGVDAVTWGPPRAETSSPP